MDEVLSIQTQWFAKRMNVDTEHSDIRDGVVQRGGQERRMRTARVADCNRESGDLGPQLDSPPASNVTLSTRWL